MINFSNTWSGVELKGLTPKGLPCLGTTLFSILQKDVLYMKGSLRRLGKMAARGNFPFYRPMIFYKSKQEQWAVAA